VNSTDAGNTFSHTVPLQMMGAIVDAPSVLILLASFNGAAWIRQQLQSILAQRGVDISIAVRDDGSADATRAIVQELATSGRIRLLPTSSGTGSAGQNFFALIRENPAENFDYVAFSDQDDIWDPDKLQNACHALQADPRIALYSSAVLAVWPDGRERILRQSTSLTRCDYLFEGAGQGCTFVLSGAFYRRVRDFMVTNPEVTRDLHYHDWPIYALARTWGLYWRFDRRPTVKYRQHGGNDTGARASFGGVRKRLSLMANGWYGGEVLAVTRLCATANPSDSLVNAWRRVAARPPSLRRQLQMAWFFVRHGRRKRADRAMLIIAAILRWL